MSSWELEREKAINKLSEKLPSSYVPKTIFYCNFDPRVVIIGQDPYPGVCNVTKIPYACEYAFQIPDEVLSCPTSLKNLFMELRNDIGCEKNISLKQIKKRVKSWIAQGVCLTNVALTRGTTGTYLDDHKNLWMAYSIEFIKSITCPVVLLGREAWHLAKFVTPGIPTLKFHHPASRNREFFGCGMFSKINNLLEDPIIF